MGSTTAQAYELRDAHHTRIGSFHDLQREAKQAANDHLQTHGEGKGCKG